MVERAHNCTCVALVIVGLMALIQGSATSAGAASIPIVERHPTAAKAAPGASARWTNAHLKPVSQPAAARGRFVVYVSGRGGLQLAGLDARTGKPLWRDAASPSGTTPGVAPVLPAIGGKVFYFKSLGGQLAQLVGADPRSGRASWRSRPFFFTAWPQPCPDESAVVCTVGTPPTRTRRLRFQGHSEPTRLLRFQARSGRLLAGAVISPDTGGRDLGAGLYDPGIRDPEELMAASGAGVGWSQPLANVFTAPDLSTDWGWGFDRFTRLGLFVGSVGGAPNQSGGQLVFDLSKTMTTGFRISDGSVVWRDPGSSYACGTDDLLSCPGSGAAGPSIALRLRETGSIIPPASGVDISVPAGDRVSVEGFDPASGRTLWSFDAGIALILHRAATPRVSANVSVLPDRNGHPYLVDLSTGAAQVAPPDTVGWCASQSVYKANVGYRGLDGKPTTQYVGGQAVFPCDLSKHPVQAPSSVPSFIGTRTSGITAWSQSGKIVAVGA